MKTNIYLGIPNVMLTVLGSSILFPSSLLVSVLICVYAWLGVVIGFVISYRAMSGYVSLFSLFSFSVSLFFLGYMSGVSLCGVVSWRENTRSPSDQ